jgi:hypothetical protein
MAESTNTSHAASQLDGPRAVRALYSPRYGLGTCPVCGLAWALTKAGELRKHRNYKQRPSCWAPAPWCEGSGRVPTEHDAGRGAHE